MTYLRWLHKSWNFFWTFIGVLILTVVLLCGIAFGLMQLSPVKQMVAQEIESRFNSQFNGVLSIGEINGMVPVLLKLNDVRLYADSIQYEPVVRVSELSANLDVIALLQNKIVIKGLHLENPDVLISRENNISIHRAFTAPDKPVGDVDNFIETLAQYQILIPSIEIDNGRLMLKEPPQYLRDRVSDSISFTNIDLALFFEFTEEQRFIDISRLNFDIPALDISDGNLMGQIYNDDQFLELNAFRLLVDNNEIRFSGEADGVDFLKGDIPAQIASSYLNFELDNARLRYETAQKLFKDLPGLPDQLQIALRAEGTLDSLHYENLEITSGESYLYGNGYLLDLTTFPSSGYGMNLENAVVDSTLLRLLPVPFNQTQLKAITESRFQGELKGLSNNINGWLSAIGERGAVTIEGMAEMSRSPLFDLRLRADSLDIGGLTAFDINETELNLEGSIKSTSLDLLKSEGGLNLSGEQGRIDHIQFDKLSLIANWKDGFIEPEINLLLDGSDLKSSGWIDLKQDKNEYSLSGKAWNLDLKHWLKVPEMANAHVDLEYELQLTGNSLNDLSGQVSIDIPQAFVGNDTLDHHQLYFDFSGPEYATRSFRFTSTAFDLTLEGNYVPSNLVQLSRQWYQYFNKRVRSEYITGTDIPADSVQVQIPSESVNVTARLKNTDLISSYFPTFPEISSSTRINSTFNASSERLLFNATWQDPRFRYGEYGMDSLLVQVTGSFRSEQKLREFSRLQLQANIASVDANFLNADKIDFYAEFNQDSIFIRNNINELVGNPDFRVLTRGALKENSIVLNVRDFSFGEDEYTWSLQNDATIEYFYDERLRFSNFAFSNLDQYISIDGTFSSSLSDSVNYEIGGVDLSRVSRIIDKRIAFNGELNGNFTSRTLTTVPAIQGDIFVENFAIDGETVGDINLASRYNSELERFDTYIDVSTDSSKYPEYFNNTGRGGQEFEIRGYVAAPKGGEFPDTDSLFVFDVDFNNIDMWILPYIGPKVFTEGSGTSSGTGKIWGNLEDYDFHADFMVGTEDAVFFRPRFLDTYYYAQGPITFTRHNGLEFKNIFLVDPSGGRAVLSGSYDFNDFQPVNYVNITLEMDEFQFLNSTFDPTAPFYGTAYGSSTVTISGTNLNPVLSTQTPMIISDFSEIGIPLLEETEFNEDNKFIRFVNSFDLSLDSAQNRSGGNVAILNPIDIPDPAELSFAERFTLDLQLEANDPMTVQLIFDPVTGDVVTADGTGRMRIRLEDGQVSMFGRFNITGGRYQFVSGDIFSRRFALEPGGSITWEGDPANANLNLNAVYRARPDINTLTIAPSEIRPENAKRVPVELVLNIGGTISSIENDFYFRPPSTFESRQNPELVSLLTAINRDEELKLIQSANFLLMGNFIPVSSMAEGQSYLFADNISGSAAVLNPLLSSQVISPLLSNQINSLLNSDLSSLDVDFNLNTYNQVDLGVALRLYNDKLILRREGQITGRQSTIGDLGATYRINRTFAVTAFHRQDLGIGPITSEQSQQAPEINGVGIEANVSFNKWKEFFNRLTWPFRKLFGISEEENENLTDNR